MLTGSALPQIETARRVRNRCPVLDACLTSRPVFPVTEVPIVTRPAARACMPGCAAISRKDRPGQRITGTGSAHPWQIPAELAHAQGGSHRFPVDLMVMCLECALGESSTEA